MWSPPIQCCCHYRCHCLYLIIIIPLTTAILILLTSSPLSPPQPCINCSRQCRQCRQWRRLVREHWTHRAVAVAPRATPPTSCPRRRLDAYQDRAVSPIWSGIFDRPKTSPPRRSSTSITSIIDSRLSCTCKTAMSGREADCILLAGEGTCLHKVSSRVFDRLLSLLSLKGETRSSLFQSTLSLTLGSIRIIFLPFCRFQWRCRRRSITYKQIFYTNIYRRRKGELLEGM